MRARCDAGVIRGRLLQRGRRMRAEEGDEADWRGHGISETGGRGACGAGEAECGNGPCVLCGASGGLLG